MYFIVGQIFKEKEMVGYKILTLETSLVNNVSLEAVRKVMTITGSSITYMNAVYKPDTGVLVGTQGSLVNYPSTYLNGTARDKKKKLAVVYEIYDKDTNKLGGYGVCDCYGVLINVSLEKFISLCSKYEPSNFTLENVNGVIQAKSLGTEFYKTRMKVPKVIKGYNSKLGEDGSTDKKICSELKMSMQGNMLPTLNVYSYDDIRNNEFAASAQDKLFKAYSNMKKLSPYYHTILMSIKREASTAVPTLAVTETTMYYNLEFISSLTVSEVTFILIHEICHIAMRHSVRHGKKDNEMWNIACDLYINSIISRDFECYYSMGEKEITTPSGKAVIKVPNSGVHLSTINEVLDFGKDSPETIYIKLISENKTKQSSPTSGSDSNQGNGGDSQQGSSQSNKRGTDSSPSSDSSSDKDSNDADDLFRNSNNNIGGNNVSNSSLSEDGTDIDQSDLYGKTKKVSVTYNGKRLEGTVNMDVITDELGDSSDRDQRVSEASLQTVQSMKTAVEIKEEKLGTSLVKNAGCGEALIKRCIEFGLSTQVNWKVLLANMCKSKPKKIYTMGSPNDVYMNSGITVASRQKIGKPTKISGIKVCVDVSGSVSEAELMKDLSEVNNIFRHYDVDGELIYWSTMIGDAGKFSELKDMLKVNPITSGGTDARCVFDYLAKKTRVNAKYEETSIKDISCILIFTDGCFSENYSDYGKYFGKKVIWIVPSSRFVFKPPFGKIACMDD